MAEMRIGDEIFNVEVEGPEDAPALMISNSLGSNLHMWDDQIPAFARRFRVVRYDSRGHGASTAPEGPYSLEQLGRDALAILDALGIEKAHWMGLSKGGAVGQWLLLNAPDRIDRAILANTASQYSSPDAWNERLRIEREQGVAGLAGAVIDRWFTPDFQAQAPQTIARIRAAFEATPAQGYAACMIALRDVDLREAIRDIRAPVLVIVGAHDPATPPALGRAIAEAIPGAQLVELNSAHLSNIEAAEAFNAAVIGFLTAPAKPARPKTFPHRKQAAGKAVKKAAKARPSARAAKKAPKKTAKKIVKKAAKKTAKKATKKAVKKAVKKTVRTAAKKAPKTAKKTLARKTVKKAAPKRAAGKAMKKAAKARPLARPVKKTVKKAAKKTAAKPARKTVKKAVKKAKKPSRR
ncbi:MAG: 3-oxoadipate enol-lactonase [Rhodoblastus sp.]